MKKEVYIEFNDCVHCIYPDESFTDVDIEKRIQWIVDCFQESKANIDEIEWIWCMVGNIVDEHKFGENKEIRHGTKQFPAGAKIYCFPPLWGDGFENVKVVGKPRKKGKMITIVMRSELITNWRIQQVYDSYVITEMLTGFGWDNSERSKTGIEKMLGFLNGSETLNEACPIPERKNYFEGTSILESLKDNEE
jgi:hypothetical protein